MPTREEYAARPRRESLSKRLGAKALQIKARDGHACVYCHADSMGEARAGRHLHLDHVKAKHEGGKDAPSNLVVACHRCNSVKQNMTLKQWSTYAAKHLELKVDPAAVRAQAAKPLPDRKTAQYKQAQVHEREVREHQLAAKSAPTKAAREDHEAAAAVQDLAAQAGKEGRLSAEHGKAAAAASKAAHKGWTRDEKGRFKSLAA